MRNMKIRYYYIVNISLIILNLLSLGAGLSGAVAQNVSSQSLYKDDPFIAQIPQPPGEDNWEFIQDLKSPMWTHNWVTLFRSEDNKNKKQADLSGGIQLKDEFPDPQGLLHTAYEDLYRFLEAGNIKNTENGYIIRTEKVSGLQEEGFRLEVRDKQCRIMATDIEGIRRGIFYLEDKLLSQHGPYLSLDTITKHPFIHRRISRCFYSPIKRPPKMRDELMDGEDYYPDNYLNRLAHEGINGLWLTVSFKDLCKTSFTPQAGVNRERRLSKLRKTVNKCLRYGIRIYIFCIEPRAWDVDDPVLKHYPELGGVRIGNKICFCPSSTTAQQYLYESVNAIFKAVPGLGGMINISHGERLTTCLSSLPATKEYTVPLQCSRCSKKEPWEILYESLSAMEKGMHEASPGAALISWLYMPQPQRFAPGDPYNLGKWVYTIPAHTPKGVILQFNFTSGVQRTEFGKLLVGGDYWLSMPGPSSRFSRITKIAQRNNTPVSAKIQTSSSHEVATVPYVPVPSLLYRKFAAMHDLGVSNSMLCWYFGNYPGLMNKAAGLLSFEPFPDEETFLHQLASIYWRKEDVPGIVRAWQLFSEGYHNYPLTNMFQYYGPMHDGPVWPLLLKPADAPLSPTWQISIKPGVPWPPSGDRIGECLGGVLTLDEAVTLCRRMSVKWDSGLAIMNRILPHYRDNPDRMADIDVARALGIQFRSGYNILHFYDLREKMLHMRGLGRLSVLKELSDIIREEMILDKQLLVLCTRDSRLGFHSEAEGYKYYPAKIKWRMRQLNKVLSDEVPVLAEQIRNNRPLFPKYTGVTPSGPVVHCTRILTDIENHEPDWHAWNGGNKNSHIGWMASYDSTALYVTLSDSAIGNSHQRDPVSDIVVKIEPRRLWPDKHFVFALNSEKRSKGKVKVVNDSSIWRMTVRIPFEDIGIDMKDLHPIRINIEVHRKGGEINSWLANHPLTPRLMLGSDNSQDLGWLIFQK